MSECENASGQSGEDDRLDLHREGYLAFMAEFIGESDRAAVVLGAAKIDGLLLAILDRFLLPHAGSEDDLLEADSPFQHSALESKLVVDLG